MLHFFELLYTLVIIDIPFLLCMDDCGMHWGILEAVTRSEVWFFYGSGDSVIQYASVKWCISSVIIHNLRLFKPEN